MNLRAAGSSSLPGERLNQWRNQWQALIERGHQVMLERPLEVNRMLLEFI